MQKPAKLNAGPASEAVALYMSRQLAAQLKAVAKKEKRSLSNLCAVLLTEALEVRRGKP